MATTETVVSHPAGARSVEQCIPEGFPGDGGDVYRGACGVLGVTYSHCRRDVGGYLHALIAEVAVAGLVVLEGRHGHASFDGAMFGRGLLIVGEVADRWGVSELAVGRAVWCELDLAVVSGRAPGDYLVASTAPPSRRTIMAEPLKTFVDGVEAEVPNSIPAIRAALPEARRAEFDHAIDEAGVHDIHAVMRHWMLEAVGDRAGHLATA